MRFLMVATIAALGLLAAPTQAMSVADKLRSLSQRIAAEADALSEAESFSESDSAITADAEADAETTAAPIKKCSATSKSSCEAQACTWFVHTSSNVGSCIIPHGRPCSEYQGYTGCEQPHNNNACVWYHDTVSAHKPACLDRDMVYQPYMIDCTGTHTKTGALDSTFGRTEAECLKEPYNTYCEWNRSECVNIPYDASKKKKTTTTTEHTPTNKPGTAHAPTHKPVKHAPTHKPA